MNKYKSLHRTRLAGDVLLTCVIFIMLAAALVVTTRCVTGGVISNVPLDTSAFDEPNPAARERRIERATTATVVVTDVWGQNDAYTVTAALPDRTDVLCDVYLPSRDVAKLNVGDEIQVRGNIKYYGSNRHYVVIGDAISVPPLTFDATLLSITNTRQKEESR